MRKFRTTEEVCACPIFVQEPCSLPQWHCQWSMQHRAHEGTLHFSHLLRSFRVWDLTLPASSSCFSMESSSAFLSGVSESESPESFPDRNSETAGSLAVDIFAFVCKSWDYEVKRRIETIDFQQFNLLVYICWKYILGRLQTAKYSQVVGLLIFIAQL